MNVQNTNGPHSHMTLPFEYQMNPVFRCLLFRWLLYIKSGIETCLDSVLFFLVSLLETRQQQWELLTSLKYIWTQKFVIKCLQKRKSKITFDYFSIYYMRLTFYFLMIQVMLTKLTYCKVKLN